MQRYTIPLVIALLLPSQFFSYSSLAASSSITIEQNQQQIANNIQQNLENHLYQLPPRIQGHFGIRMYRMTGNEKYANSALVDLYTVTEAQAYFGCNLNNDHFRQQATQASIDNLGKGPRAKARKKALAPFSEFIFYTDILLRYASRINEFGLIGPCHQQVINSLKKQDLTAGFTNKAMIKAWSAQLANYAYWAKQLGVGDYVEQYTRAFRNTYPDNQDHDLSKRQFKNKIYGMTHFIFAASEYYQDTVDKHKFQWVLSYFENNIDRILAETTPDIIAEVGISFLLANDVDNPVIDKTKQAVLKAYDSNIRFIPSPMGNPSLTLGEHRNVLAIMLLKWPTTLHKGPYLAEIAATKKNLPKGVQAKKNKH